MTKCRYCGRANPDRAPFCDRCGKPLVAEQVSIQSRVCPNCGVMNPVSATSCKNCFMALPSLYPEISSTLASTGLPAQTDGWPQDAADTPSQRPAIAALLMVGGGISELILAVRDLTMHVPATDLPIDLSGLVTFCGALELILGLIVIAGGLVAFRKGSFTLILVAAIAGMLGVGPFYVGFIMSLIALILVALSRDEFEE